LTFARVGIAVQARFPESRYLPLTLNLRKHRSSFSFAKLKSPTFLPDRSDLDGLIYGGTMLFSAWRRLRENQSHPEGQVTFQRISGLFKAIQRISKQQFTSMLTLKPQPSTAS
jgi:hypothetical protein